jgi:hypothetical protein
VPEGRESSKLAAKRVGLGFTAGFVDTRMTRKKPTTTGRFIVIYAAADSIGSEKQKAAPWDPF